jgi:Phage Mu protein F like protein
MSARFAEEEDLERKALDGADWAPIAKAVVDEASEVAADAAKRALTLVRIDADESMFDQVSQDAIDWAKARGAELVGKKWRGGELVDSSDAEDAILDETRDEIRAALAQAIEQGDSAAELGERIEALGAFSEERAARIAQYELTSASNAGHMISFRASGVVQKKSWSTSNEPSVCEICQGNADQGAIDLDEDFDSGDDAPPGHVGCECVVVPEVEEQSEEESDDEDEDEEAAE